MKTAADVAANWATKMAQASSAYTKGVQGVTQAPNAAAAAAASSYAQGTAAAVSSGKYQQANQNVSLSAWQQASINKGAPRLASGAQAAQQKVQAVMGPLLSHIAAGVAALPAKQSRGNNDQRMLQFSAHMKQFRKGG